MGQDEINIDFFSIKRRFISSLSMNNDQTKDTLFNLIFSNKKKGDYSGHNQTIGIGHCILLHPTNFHKHYDLLAKRRSNRFFIQIQLIQEQERELLSFRYLDRHANKRYFL